jgi:hypothetical protein
MGITPASKDNRKRVTGMNTETKVSDLQLAAYLMALDYPLLRVEGSHKQQVFVYEAPQEVIMQYYRGADKTSARKLLGAYRDLKGIIMQTLRANY